MNLLIKLHLTAVRNLRLVLFGFILVLLGSWILMGRTFLGIPPSKDQGQEEIGQTQESDPIRAGALRRSEEDRDDERRNQIPYQVALVKIAVIAGLAKDEERLEEFLLSHGTICSLLAEDSNEDALKEYLENLEAAREKESVWRVIWNDAAGLVLWPFLQNRPELWQFYEQERDWLTELLVELAVNEEEGIDPEQMVEAIETAHQLHPLVQETVVNEKLGARALRLFIAHKPVIENVIRQKCVPAVELLEVLFLNGEYIEAHQDVAKLCQIYRNHPHVWLYAKHYPDVIRFYDDLPKLAEEILERYGDHGIVDLLYEYGKQLERAGQALTTFGNTAFHLLKSCKKDTRFRTCLGHPDIGIRVIPFLQKFGVEEGLERLENDSAWAAKYFHSNGDPRDPSLMTAVPFIGGPANVASNWKNGYPNEWSELGWAAFDVASTGLLAVSFGTTSAATAGGRQALKTANQQALKRGSQAAIKIRMAPLRTGAGKGIRSASKATALRRTIATASRATSNAGSAIARSSRSVWRSGRQLKSQWQSIPPTYRITTYRALLATSLYLTLTHRTIPVITETGAERIGQAAGELVRTIATGTGEIMGDVLQAAKSEIVSDLQTPPIWWRRFLYFTGFSCLFLMAIWCIHPYLRPRKKLSA